MKKIRNEKHKNADAATGDLLLTDPDLKRLGRRLQRQEKRLKETVGSEPYKLYLDIEETHLERYFTLARRIWAIARSLGRREARNAAKSKIPKRD